MSGSSSSSDDDSYHKRRSELITHELNKKRIQDEEDLRRSLERKREEKSQALHTAEQALLKRDPIHFDGKYSFMF